MSYQRAVINCKRCHGLASEMSRLYSETSKGNPDDKMDKILLHSDEFWQARNSAMLALETERTRIPITGTILALKSTKTPDPDDKILQAVYLRNYRALNTCMACDYSQPYLANLLQSDEFLKVKI